MKKLILAAAISSLFGCATAPIKEQIKTDRASAEAQIQAARDQLPDDKEAPIVLPMSKVPHLIQTALPDSDDKPDDLPLVLRDDTLVHFDEGPLTLEHFGRLIAEETGLNVKVIVPAPVQQVGGAKGGAGAMPAVPPMVDIGRFPKMPLRQLLTKSSSAYGVDWDFYDNTLYLAGSFPRIYRVDNSNSHSAGTMHLGKTSTAQTGASGGTNSGTSGNFNSNLDATVDSSTNYWDDILATAKKLAGDNNVVASSSLGFLTVNCSKDCHRKIKQLVDDANLQMTQQVLIHVVEVTVTVGDTAQSGVNWNAVYQSIGWGRNWAFSFGSPASLVSSAAAGPSFNILQPTTGQANGFQGSNLMFQALSQASTVVDNKPFDLIAINNEPSTLASTDQQSFTASTTVVPTGVAGTPVYSSIPGYVTFGQFVSVIPTVLQHGKIMIRVGLDDSDLKNLTKATTPGGIDTTLMGQFNWTSKAILKPGSTLILSGFRRNQANWNSQGVLPGQHLGSDSGSTTKTETILLITPYLAGV